MSVEERERDVEASLIGKKNSKQKERQKGSSARLPEMERPKTTVTEQRRGQKYDSDVEMFRKSGISARTVPKNTFAIAIAAIRDHRRKRLLHSIPRMTRMQIPGRSSGGADGC